MPDPQHFFANLQRAELLLNANRGKEAIPFAQAAITADPNNAQGYALLARAWGALGNPRALNAINTAIGLQPTDANLRAAKSWIHLNRYNFLHARRSALDGLEIDPQSVSCLIHLAYAAINLRDWPAAEKTCRHILSISPVSAPGLNLLAHALREQSRYRESREVVGQILALMPDNSFGHANAGHAALESGDYTRANHHFLESLRLDPHSASARSGYLKSLRSRIWLTRFNRRAFAFMRMAPTLHNLGLLFFAMFGTLALAVLVILFAPETGGPVVGILFVAFLGYITISCIIGLLSYSLLLVHPSSRHSLTLTDKVGGFIPLAAAGLFLGWLAYTGYWWVLLIIAILFAALALSLLVPLWYDNLQQRRLDQAES